MKYKFLIFVAIILINISCTKYSTINYNAYYNKDLDMNFKECQINFPVMGEKKSIMFQEVRSKNDDEVVLYIIGNLWLVNWGNFDNLNIYTDSNKYHIKAENSYRDNNKVLDNSAEVEIYFKIIKSILNDVKKSSSLKLKIVGKKTSREFLFNKEQLLIVKNWIRKI
ncbi:MAG: hypothetical protein PF574_04105 [Candidatus Delongbacteria bacterium]|jgi:hypothetical protein|nr:hypothetical protein [Candidatus Delongbacteria bacterium]